MTQRKGLEAAFVEQVYFLQRLFGVCLMRTVMRLGGVNPCKLPLGTTIACCWGFGRGEGAGRGQGAGLLGKEVLPAGGPGFNGKLQILYSRKQGFTVPAEPSPTECGCEQPTDRLSWRTKPRSACAV